MSVEFSVPKISLVNPFSGQPLKLKETFHVQNRFESSRKIRVALSKASNYNFHLLSGTAERYVAAGLKLTVVLEYVPQSGEEHRGDIEVFVNERLLLSVPIEALPPSPCITVDSAVVDFGCLVNEHQMASGHFTIRNTGSKDGTFSVVSTNLPQDFTVCCTQGTLAPGQFLDIIVELVCKESGPFNEEIFVVPSDASGPIRIALSGELVSRQLQLLDPINQSTILQRVAFGDTYYGTAVTRKVVLYNNSPVSTQYMAVMDAGCVGSEDGVDMSEGLAMACTSGGLGQDKWREQGFTPSQSTIVTVNPSQGTLGAFQKTMIELYFSPSFVANEVGWGSHQGIPLPRDYSLFIKFLKVGHHTGDDLEAAITGRACPVQLSLKPDRIINFGTCETGTTSTVDLQIINESSTLSVDYQCRQLAHYKCKPNTGKLLPGEVGSIAVSFSPKQLGRLNYKLHIDVIRTVKDSLGKIRNGPVYTAVIDLNGTGGAAPAKKKDKRLKLAHPNDLSTSVRPHDEKNTGEIITPYTKIPRHTYVDPDYCYTEQETTAHSTLRNTYTDFIRSQREGRVWQEKELQHRLGGPVDMNMAPAQGLSSPVVSTTELSSGSCKQPSSLADRTGMMTTSDLVEATSRQLEFVSVCPTKAETGKIAAQCKKTLSSQELSQVIIVPSVVDYGSVVVNSIAELKLSLSNHTESYISFKMKLTGSGVCCESYGNKMIFQLFIPPLSITQLPLSLCLHDVGPFERSIEYVINGHHSSHLPVKANVTELSLKLSTKTVKLTEPPLARQSTGLHGSVVISNPHNIPAFFRWLANEGVQTDVFNMLHPSGYVPASDCLECEFVYQPSYHSPLSARFLLDDGRSDSENIVTLVAEFDRPACSIREKRVLFGTIPLKVTTTRTIHIDNTGLCHAYYKVVDCSPHPGLRVSPDNGVVPTGGAASLKVLLCPEAVGNIDIRVCVALREGKTISFRLAGMVEQPILSIDQELFRFGSVYCGARATESFTVTNKGLTVAELTFDLSHHPDFSLLLPTSHDPYSEPMSQSDGAGLHTLKIPGKSSVDCQLEFCPEEVAAFDFSLPVLVNGLPPPGPPPSPWPPSQSSSYVTTSQATKQGLVLPSFSNTPSRRVLATALRPPLKISHLLFDFTQLSLNTTVCHETLCTLSNVSGERVSWAFGRAQGFSRVEDGTFQFALQSQQSFQPPVVSMENSDTSSDEPFFIAPGESFSFHVLCTPGHHGEFSASIPLIVNGSLSQPYRELTLTAHLPGSQISVVPGCIDVLPVPLGVSLTAQFAVIVEGFSQSVDLEIQVPPMAAGVSFTVFFPSGSVVEDCRASRVQLPCVLEFSSSEPVSVSDCVIILDKATGKRKKLPFTVCADNSLFSVYKFLSQNVHQSSITLTSNVPTLILQSQSFEDSQGNGSSASLSSQDSGVKHTALSLHTSATFSEMFHQDCVSAVCRWVSAYGWSEGIKSILSPSDLRRRVGNDLPKPGVKQRSTISTSRGLLVDLLTHICGRVPPGIPLNLPPCTTASEKVNQQYSTCSTIISFLKSQGGLLWSVVPEALLDYQDYRQWLRDVDGRGSLGFRPSSQEEFNQLSNQAWTHLLMQIVKILVLPRATAHIPKSIVDSVDTSSSTLESNVYSRHERVLLAWLNHHYRLQRDSLFRATDVSLGDVLNFDVDLMDCTVFACVLASYCPFLVESHLSKLFPESANPEQCTHNAIVFIRALRHIGLDYDLQACDLVSPDPISLLLFTAYLSHKLPAFKPRGKPVVFEGNLNSNIRNQILLNNTSAKSLEYRIMMRGGAMGKFTIEDNKQSITVGGKQTGQLSVSYRASSICDTETTLLLVARGGRAVAGSTLAFRLTGHTTNFKPQATACLTACQYDCHTTTVRVSNTYNTSGKFAVKLYETDEKTLAQSLGPGSRKKLTNGTPCALPTSTLSQRTQDGMQLFNCEAQIIELEPNQSTVISMKFVPLKMNSRRCFVVLSDPGLGDIVCSVTATVQPPRPLLPLTRQLNPHTIVNTETRTLHMKVHAGQAIEEELVLGSSNEAFENALLEISSWEMSEVELSRRQLTESLRFAALSTAIATLGLEGRTCHDDQSVDSNLLWFEVQGSDHEHFTLPDKVAIPANNTGVASLPVKFHSDQEGQYECTLLLRSSHDVRVLVIETTVLARGRHAHLELSTHAMEPLTQDIPIVNPSTVDWPLIASLRGAGFTGPQSLVARPLSTTNYPLTFEPHVQGTVEGELRLLNNSDGSEYVFALTGIAKKPLAQDHIVLRAQAKRRLSHILHVPNHHERTAVFRVESDLDFISGPSTITVGGYDVVDYCLEVVPKQQGTFSGSIAFITEAVSRPHSYNESLEATRQPEQSPYHVWFHIECLVIPAPPDHVITVATPTLSTTTLPIVIANPQSEQLKLQISLEGHGLSGPASFEVAPGAEASYPLTFAPTLHGRTEGRAVFNGSPEGEMWYKLVLSAEDPDDIAMPKIQCELGRTTTQTVLLSNPLNETVLFDCVNSNTKHFTVTGLPEGQVSVGPGSSAEVVILFNPSALGDDHTTELAFTSTQIGRQVFSLKGEGLPPTSMDPITINAAINANTVHNINFTNPLESPTLFFIQLRGKDLDHFCLLLKRTTSILLHPGVSLDVPVMFAPEAVYEHTVSVAVVAELSRSPKQQLCWSYPIVGQPVLRPFSPASAPRITCCSKERVQKTLEVSLAGCKATVQVSPNTSGSNIADSSEDLSGELSFKLICLDPKYNALVSQCTGVKLIQQTEKVVDGENSIGLELDIVFAPPKSFSCVCELKVSCSKGGVWLFPLHFSSSPAKPDDTIVIESRGLNKESKLGFRLTSGNQSSSLFTAKLAPGSDPDLTVSPTSGTLGPANSKGTLFCINYRPTAYGRSHHATLIVQSDSSEWIYEIVGQPPSYSPISAPARVQHKLDTPLKLTSSRKNFIVENILKLS